MNFEDITSIRRREYARTDLTMLTDSQYAEMNDFLESVKEKRRNTIDWEHEKYYREEKELRRLIEEIKWLRMKKILTMATANCRIKDMAMRKRPSGMTESETVLYKSTMKMMDIHMGVSQ